MLERQCVFKLINAPNNNQKEFLRREDTFYEETNDFQLLIGNENDTNSIQLFVLAKYTFDIMNEQSNANEFGLVFVWCTRCASIKRFVFINSYHANDTTIRVDACTSGAAAVCYP